MYLKFKVKSEGNEWKVYECKNYSYRTFKLSEIIDFILEMRNPNNPQPLVLPHWLAEADIIIIPDIDKDLYEEDRIVSSKHVQLLNTDCILFTISTTFDNNLIYVLTTKDVFVEGDKGQTVGRFNPNLMK